MSQSVSEGLLVPTMVVVGGATELMPNDFLEAPTTVVGSSDFVDSLSLIGGGFVGAREISLDDVVTLDLSSLEPQQPALSEFLTESGFCCGPNGQEYKVEPQYKNGALTNTISISQLHHPDSAGLSELLLLPPVLDSRPAVETADGTKRKRKRKSITQRKKSRKPEIEPSAQPRFKIVQKPFVDPTPERVSSKAVAKSGSDPPEQPSASQVSCTTANGTDGLKRISELRPEDVCTVRRDPLKKLSAIELKQIVNILAQRALSQQAPPDLGTSENSKIICRVMYPDEFVKKPASDTTRTDVDGSSSSAAGGNKKPAVNRTRKLKSKRGTDSDQELQLLLASSVTRCGRTSRPPKSLFGGQLKNDERAVGVAEEKTESAVRVSLNDPPAKSPLLEGLSTVKKKSNFRRCPTCDKGYLDKRVLYKHLQNFPFHADKKFIAKLQLEVSAEAATSERQKKRCKCKCRTSQHCRVKRFSLKQMVDAASDTEFLKACAPKLAQSTSLWDFLLLRVRTIFEFEDQVKGLLGEVEQLVETLKSFSNKLLFPSNEPSELTVEIRDDTMCDVMGVGKGTYRTFPSQLEQSMPGFGQQRTDEELTSADGKEDISQSSLLGDLSGMDTVDQLVSERLLTLAPGDDLILTMDPTSDDLMSSLLHSVGDSMFNPPGSGSTEDLLQALANLSNDLQPDQPPPIDFTALSSQFNSSDR